MAIVDSLVTLFAERLEVIVIVSQRIALYGVVRGRKRYNVVYIFRRPYHRRLFCKAQLTERIVGELYSPQTLPAFALVYLSAELCNSIAYG